MAEVDIDLAPNQHHSPFPLFSDNLSSLSLAPLTLYSSRTNSTLSKVGLQSQNRFRGPMTNEQSPFLLCLCLPERVVRSLIYRIVLTQGYSARPFAFTAMTLPDMRRTVTYGFALKINLLLLCERTRFLRNVES